MRPDVPDGFLPYRVPTLVAPRVPRRVPWRALAWATALFLWDGVIAGQGFFAMVAALVVAVYLLPRALWDAFHGRRSAAQTRGLRAAIWATMAVATFAYVAHSSSGGIEREATVIAAVHRYHDQVGHYPDSLSDLVPHLLPQVPQATHRMMMGEFRYWRTGDDALLIWVVVPPFGRRTYDFEQRRHGFLD